jgi:hypothetical protein
MAACLEKQVFWNSDAIQTLVCANTIQLKQKLLSEGMQFPEIGRLPAAAAYFLALAAGITGIVRALFAAVRQTPLKRQMLENAKCL